MVAITVTIPSLVITVALVGLHKVLSKVRKKTKQNEWKKKKTRQKKNKIQLQRQPWELRTLMLLLFYARKCYACDSLCVFFSLYSYIKTLSLQITRSNTHKKNRRSLWWNGISVSLLYVYGIFFLVFLV